MSLWCLLVGAGEHLIYRHSVLEALWNYSINNQINRRGLRSSEKDSEFRATNQEGTVCPMSSLCLPGRHTVAGRRQTARSRRGKRAQGIFPCCFSLQMVPPARARPRPEPANSTWVAHVSGHQAGNSTCCLRPLTWHSARGVSTAGGTLTHLLQRGLPQMHF